MRRFVQMMLAVVAVVTSGARAWADDPTPLLVPEAAGDQVVYYYDARPDFTTFITLRNGSGDELTATVLFYGPTFSTPFAKAVTLAAGSITILDVGALRGSGLPAQPGAAFATAVNLTGQPITSGALSGNFTVANFLTGSAWGAAGAARSAVDGDNDDVANGVVIDGDDATLRPIRPDALLLATYYDPSSLAPVSSSGNQLIFLTFEDEYEATYSAGIGSTSWDVSTTRGNGAGIGDTTFTANGVTVSDLASVAGSGVNGAAGSMVFTGSAADALQSRMIYFAEALGTYGTGYLLPPLLIP